ncbi:MAG TPA: aminoglycoside phosphotransferase family protein [Chloroflexota bacterium]|nr:aminoglycoside phosphotransferase family protein [Chloroflexota bacterium]
MGGAGTVTPPLIGWLQACWPAYDWARALVHRSCFHEVAIVAPEVVARVSRHGDQVARVRREHSVLRALAAVALPVEVPRTRSEVVAWEGRAGMLTTYVPGQPRPGVSWHEAAGPVGEVLRALAGADVTPLRGRLPVPRAWCGGEQWPAMVRERLAPHLPADLRSRAEAVVGAVLEAERGAAPALVHGDFGPHNLLWDRDGVVGVIDLDHACLGDAAMDAATLIGFFGAAAVETVVDSRTLERGMLHRATLALQLAAAAELLGDEPLRDHALGNFVARARARTLYDPGGRHPPG